MRIFSIMIGAVCLLNLFSPAVYAETISYTTQLPNDERVSLRSPLVGDLAARTFGAGSYIPLFDPSMGTLTNVIFVYQYFDSFDYYFSARDNEAGILGSPDGGYGNGGTASAVFDIGATIMVEREISGSPSSTREVALFTDFDLSFALPELSCSTGISISPVSCATPTSTFTPRILSPRTYDASGISLNAFLLGGDPLIFRETYQKIVDITSCGTDTGDLCVYEIEAYRNAGSRLPSQFTVTYEYSVVPIPAAAWLFGSGLLGLIGVARRRAGA
jgi:hypothetical protein